MLPKIQYNLTHWVDGMKIRRDHFVNSENALLDAVRDAAAGQLTNFNFGLLTPAAGDRKSLEITVLRSQSDDFKISVSLCRAITAGGSRIEIMPEYHEEIICEDKAEALISGRSKAYSSFWAVITVDPFNRVPFGNPSPEETPPRNPHSKPNYRLNLIAEEDLETEGFSAFHFPVAKFKLKAKELTLDNTYIPPCALIQGHPAMVQLYKGIGESLNKIQEYTSEIVKKVIGKSQNTTLALSVRKLSEQCARSISSEFFKIRMVYTQSPPIHLADVVVRLANDIKLTLDFMIEKEKEEMLNYFKEQTQLTSAAFYEMIVNVIDLDYDHYNIYDSFAPILSCLEKLTDIFEKLSELDLIGSRKSKDIFVRELDVNDGKPAKKKGFNLLD